MKIPGNLSNLEINTNAIDQADSATFQFNQINERSNLNSTLIMNESESGAGNNEKPVVSVTPEGLAESIDQHLIDKIKPRSFSNSSSDSDFY